MRPVHESLFAHNLSVWEALKLVMENVEPFKTNLRALREGLYEEELAKVMALHDWRPMVPIKTLFDSYGDLGCPTIFYEPQFDREEQPQDRAEIQNSNGASSSSSDYSEQ